MPELTVSETVESYLTERAPDVSASTLQNHRYQLKQWRQWVEECDEITCVADIAPMHLSRFRRARSEDINSNTMYNQLSSLRVYLDYCARMQWVDAALPESIVLPTRDGVARDRSISEDRADEILDALDKYRRGDRAHVTFALLWETGMRIGAVRGGDVGDVHLDDRYIDVRHRPETGTPLKNKSDGERHVNLHGWVVPILEDWLDGRRSSTTDSSGREPLVSTRHGRVSRSSIRRTIYRLTDCSDIGTPGNCDCSPRPSKCSESVSPHDIRRSAISAWLDRGHDPSLLSQRFDLSQSTMRRHYDVRSKSDRRSLRRDAFDM